MRKMSENPHTGSSFDDFLKEEGIYEKCTAMALKRVLAWQIEQEMSRQKITKSVMASRMHTSRSQLDRLLDPEITGISLEVLQRAATVVGRELYMELR
jgi:predicted XRE-type DNA-binding protein